MFSYYNTNTPLTMDPEIYPAQRNVQVITMKKAKKVIRFIIKPL